MARHFEHFIDRFKDFRALAAHMNSKDRIVPFKHFAQRDELVNRAVRTGRINQAERHAKCAFAKFPLKHALHMFLFLESRFSHAKSHDHAAKCAVTDKDADICRGWATFQVFGIIRQRIVLDGPAIHRQFET